MTQMRVAAGSDYVAGIRGLLRGEPSPGALRGLGDYDLRFFDDLGEMRRQILEREREHGLARLLAGYAWKWRSRKDPSAFDIEIGDVQLRWNSTDKDWINQANSVKGMEGITLEVQPSYRLDYVYLNHAKKPFDDKRIRLALNYAANREAIMKAVYFGFGEIPNSYMPKVNFWSDKVAKIPYDIEKAKALVQEAGYDGTPIQLMVDTGNAPSRTAATILQQGWQQAGLKVEIVEYDVGTAFSMTQKGEFQAYVSYITSDINDDDELASIQADGTGATAAFFSNYKNEEVTKLLAQARETGDKAKRAELYGKVQDIVYNDAYSVPLNFLPYVNGVQNYVKNWHNITVGWWWLRDVWLDK